MSNRGTIIGACAALTFAWGNFATAGEGPATIHPITNPVYADTAVPESKVTLIAAHHRLPSKVSLSGGGTAPLDGDVNVLALQIEYAFSETLSLTAIKDGYVDFNPEGALAGADDEGFNDLALGLKYMFYNEDGWAAAFRGTIELPSGDEEVLQGNGEGDVSPALLLTRSGEKSQCNLVIGATIPFDGDDEATMSYVSYGHARKLTDKLTLMGELNWWRVLDAGEGTAGVPGVLSFEGPDLINLGNANGDDDPNQVTAALGLRYQFNDAVNAGFAYELPLTDEKESLTDDRFTLSVTFHY
jgi:hypothetical protein